MKCLNCGKELDTNIEKCLYCGKNIIEMQEKWGKKETIDITNKEEKLKELRKRNEARKQELLEKKQEEEQKKKEIEQFINTADDLILDCEGNVFKAIKMFKEKFNVNNDIAKEYIMNAQRKFSVDDTYEKNTSLQLNVEEKNTNDEIFSDINNNRPKCPTCNSTDIEKISMVGKITSVSVFGLASNNIGKTFKCNKCGYKW